MSMNILYFKIVYILFVYLYFKIVCVTNVF